MIDRIDALRTAFSEARTAQPFRLDVIIVLPDHLHCIWRLPEGDADNAGRWRRIKTGFARCIPPHEYLSPTRRARNERGIWQRRYWEHLIKDDEDYRDPKGGRVIIRFNRIFTPSHFLFLASVARGSEAHLGLYF